MKKFLYLLIVLLIILGLLVTGLYFLPDEPLSQEVANWLQAEKTTLPSEQNGYFSLMGLFAAAEQNPHTVGMERATAFEKALAQHQGMADDLTFDDYPDSPKLAVSSEVPDALCRVEETACLETFASQAETLQQLIADHQVLMTRYLNLSQMGYEDNVLPATVATPFPPFRLLMAVHRLHLTKIGVMYMTGDKINALQSLQQDIEYLRLMLANSSTLITKMVAVNLLTRDLHLYAQLLDAHPPPADDMIAQANHLPTLSTAERSLEKAMHFEFQMISRLYLNLSREEISAEMFSSENMLVSWGTFKPHATINHAYPIYKYTADLSLLPTTAFVTQSAQFSEPAPGLWDYLYNSVGTILSEIARPDFNRFVSKLIDLEGFIRLVQLKQHIRSQGITESQLSDWLATQADQYGNPYTGQPMRWDAERQQLYFDNPTEERIVLELP